MTLISDALRKEVLDRAHGLCEYCQLPQVSQVSTFPVDHVKPVSAGGQTSNENLALACPRCNATKWTHTSAVDSQTGDRTPLFDPRRDAWAEHFQWSAADLTLLEPLSAVGRATVELLELNSPHRRHIRRWLIALELHPPSG